jgi:plasmid maintenance system antidote protein VapI
MSEGDGTPASFTCPCCGATSSHPEDIAHGFCARCHWWTGDPQLGPPHLAEACPERKAAPDWTLRLGETLADLLIEGHMSTLDAGKVTGLRAEDIEAVIGGSLAVDERVAERLAKLGPSAQFWLNYQANYDADLARGAKDVSRGAGA